MPVVEFTLRWPDGTRQRCTSPSTVVHEHLQPGMALPVDEFVARSGEAMAAASARVRERYGFACTAAAEQQAAIERAAARFAPHGGTVEVLSVGGRAPGGVL